MKLLPKEVSLRQSDQTHKVGRCCTSFSRLVDDKYRAKLTFLAHQRCLTVVPKTRFFFFQSMIFLSKLKSMYTDMLYLVMYLILFVY